MEPKNERKLTGGQEAVTKLTSTLAGIGGGGLIGGCLLSIAGNLTGVGKVLKCLYSIGCIGAGWAAQNIITRETEATMERMFGAVNALKESAGKIKEAAKDPEMAEGEVV